jgi:iron uptake system component EfeO
MTRTTGLVAVAALGLLALGACSSSDGSASAATTAVTVTADDQTCAISPAAAKAGTVAFTVTNDGQQVTEVYVYASGDTVVAEKEDITPGSTVEFTAEVAAGTYDVACKPGMTGDGIRSVLTVG